MTVASGRAEGGRVIDRRAFLATAGAGIVAAPLVSAAQQAGKVWRIGFLYSGSRQSAVETGRYRAFQDGLRDLGYAEGKNLAIEARFFEGDPERLRAFSAELIHLRPDVVVASGPAPAKALQQVSTTIPIIVAVAFDPVREGLVASLARPGGNITGLAALLDDVFPKQVQLLKEAMPHLARLAVLLKPNNASHAGVRKRVDETAGKLGIHVLGVEASTLRDVESAFTTAERERAEALIVLGDAFFVQHFQHIAALAVRGRLASTYSGREYPESGGLMSYGPNFSDHYRRVGYYVDRILKGAKPAVLPVEQPTKFELVINLKTARALRLTIPQSLLLQADEVIQ
jgi:putative ABC transport system substrate-binding protein